MDKKTVKENLLYVFLMREKAEEMYELRRDAQLAEDVADGKVIEAKGFLRKSIEDSQEIYIIIEGKSYKITPDNSDKFGIFIEEIEIIK